MATVEDIRKLLADQKLEIVNDITAKIDSIDGKLNTVIATVNDHGNSLDDHDVRIVRLENDLKAALVKQDDLINRSLRNNIVIRGLAGDESTWDETRIKVAELLGELDGNKSDAIYYASTIERAHRQGKKEEGKIRTIYARLYSSEQVKYYVKQARLARIDNKRLKYRVDHQYSEALQERRNTAMLKRREIVDSGDFVSALLIFQHDLS